MEILLIIFVFSIFEKTIFEKIICKTTEIKPSNFTLNDIV